MSIEHDASAKRRDGFETKARAAFPTLSAYEPRVSGGHDGLPYRVTFPDNTPGLADTYGADGLSFTFFDEHDLRRVLLRVGAMVRTALERRAAASAAALEETRAEIAKQAAALAEVEGWRT